MTSNLHLTSFHFAQWLNASQKVVPIWTSLAIGSQINCWREEVSTIRCADATWNKLFLTLPAMIHCNRTHQSEEEFSLIINIVVITRILTFELGWLQASIHQAWWAFLLSSSGSIKADLLQQPAKHAVQSLCVSLILIKPRKRSCLKLSRVDPGFNRLLWYSLIKNPPTRTLHYVTALSHSSKIEE